MGCHGVGQTSEIGRQIKSSKCDEDDEYLSVDIRFVYCMIIVSRVVLNGWSRRYLSLFYSKPSSERLYQGAYI